VQLLPTSFGIDMYSAIFAIVGKAFQILWPFILAIILFFAGWRYGSDHVQQQWNEREKQVAIASAQIKTEAQDKILELKKESDNLKTHIQVMSNEHQEIIDNLTVSSNNSLAERVRREQAACRANSLSNNSNKPAANLEPTVTGDRTFLEESGESLVEQSKYADELTESLRACRDWVRGLENNKSLNFGEAK